MKDVLLIFKTHLDCGYTDLASKVLKRYLHKFIPNAIKLAKETKNTDTPFIWNTGTWLLNEALKHDKNGVVDDAIRQGLICWHALPFTTHTELMNSQIVEYSLSLSHKLDEKYNRKTIAAKMTDVPGHTIGLVHHLANNGVKLLHIGINPATPVPNVPKVFNWKLGNEQVAVIVNGGGYGGSVEFGDKAVEFFITNDNCGPQTIEDIKKIYVDMRQKYPGANIHAGSLNDLAEMVDTSISPVVTSEIGDTWIHGSGTDPLKIAKYRSVLRKIADKDLSQYDITDNLLMVPEHTCGLCVQRYFGNEKAYLQKDFVKTKHKHSRKYIESSWNEQRHYVDKAAKLFNIDLRKEFNVKPFDLKGFEKIKVDKLPIKIEYQLFDKSDFDRYKSQYSQTDVLWAIYDYTKVGLPEYAGGTFSGKCTSAWKKNDEYVYSIEFDKDIELMCGLPKIMVYSCNGHIEIRWFGKKANRLPEAYWVKFNDVIDGNWQLEKLGNYVSSDNVLGSPFIHAIESKVKNDDVEITSFDAVLVAPYGKKLLHYGEKVDSQDLYFNLYNNIWNTNFPLWFSDDMRYRFEIKKIK